MIQYDYHTHSSFSFDAEESIEHMLLQAEALGLKGLCLTDHMDFEYPSEQPSFILDAAQYDAEINRLKQKYQNRIQLFYGIEIGLRNEPDVIKRTDTYYHALMEKYPYDFVIGSTHVLEYEDPYHASYWKERSAEDGLSAYFQSIIDNTLQYDQFQVYGHLDYISRVLPEEPRGYAYGQFADAIDQILDMLIEHGRGIELNTSGWRYGLSFPHPRMEILKRYRELGGELLTIGSDAHRAGDIAFGFQKAGELLLSLGYRYYTTYEKQKPIFHRL